MITLFGGNQFIDIKWWNFPSGERGLKIIRPQDIIDFRSFTIQLNYESDSDFMDMALLVNAVRNINKSTLIRLKVPYLPYARQDRLMDAGESFSLQVAVNLIKSCNFTQVEVWDPHSDVVAGMFEPGMLLVIPQWELLKPLVEFSAIGYEDGTVALVSPDAGAAKKIYKLAKLTNLPVIEANKVRDCTNGNILYSYIDMSFVNQYKKLIICDDICGYGGTFIQLVDYIRNGEFEGKVDLITTHGAYDKEAHDNLMKVFNSVDCVNKLRKI